jgi:biopolymer transport protein ExbD
VSAGFRTRGFRARRSPASLDITPLVDCIFQLLIFFLLTWSFITTPNLGVELPRASATPQSGQQRDLIVVVTRAGELELNGRKLAAGGLRAALLEAYRERPTARVLIQADRLAHHGEVVTVMDLAKSAGFRRLGVAIQSR